MKIAGAITLLGVVSVTVVLSGVLAGEPSSRRAHELLRAALDHRPISTYVEVQQIRLAPAPNAKPYQHSYIVTYTLALKRDSETIDRALAKLGDAQMLTRQIVAHELHKLFGGQGKAGDTATITAIATYADTAQREFINNDASWQLLNLAEQRGEGWQL